MAAVAGGTEHFLVQHGAPLLIDFVGHFPSGPLAAVISWSAMHHLLEINGPQSMLKLAAHVRLRSRRPIRVVHLERDLIARTAVSFATAVFYVEASPETTVV